jgi:hypothetical protein
MTLLKEGKQMHNLYVDELYTRQRSADLIRDAAREKEIRDFEKMATNPNNKVRTSGDGGSLQIKIVMTRVENDRLITVEVH